MLWDFFLIFELGKILALDKAEVVIGRKIRKLRRDSRRWLDICKESRTAQSGGIRMASEQGGVRELRRAQTGGLHGFGWRCSIFGPLV